VSATEALKAARAAGIHVEIEGNDLLLAAAGPPPVPLLDLLSRHKTGIIMLLRQLRTAWSSEDWRSYFDERARTSKSESGLPRPAAQARAFQSCVIRWLELHPATSEPDRCAWCGTTDTPGNIVPFGAEPIGHVWLHHRCWEPWYGQRRAQAAEALRCLGIIGEDTGSKQP